MCLIENRHFTSVPRFFLIGVASFSLNLTLISKNAAADMLYLDLSATGSYSKVSGITNPPTLGQFGLGITAAYNWTSSIFIGVSSDYRLINQYSDLDVAVGNYRGSRWNMASPTLGFQFGSFVTKIDLQILGNYELANATATGSKIAFKGPIGGRISISYPFQGSIYLGAFYETLSFKTLNDSASGDSALSQKLTLWQSGICVTYTPWAQGGSSYY